jgi:outer membrane autotransporter protein
MTATLASSLTGASDLEKTDYGTLILTGANSYTGGTKITAGTLSVSSDANLGDAAGALAFDGGTLAATASFDTQRAVALDSAGTIDVAAGTTLGLKGDISGAGSLVKNGDGTLGLWGTNTYSGGTTLNGGTLVANSAGAFGAGSAYILNGGTLKLNGWDATLSSLSGTGGTLLLGPGDMAAGNLTLDQGTDTAYAGALAGTMEFYKRGSGALTLTGDSSAFAGSTRVGAGTLRIDGTLGGSVTVQGGTLTGAGRVLGDVTLTGGALAAASGQTLRVDGDLALGAGSELDVALGAASGTALVSVGGNLDLNGTLNVTDAGSFGLGVYRLIDYGGALSGTGLTVGTTPSGVSAADLDVQTSVANQVNLVVQSGGGQTAQLGFWDGSNAALHDNGAVDGGTGIWSADGGNWTQADGAVNGAYSPNPTYAVFQNIGGLVAVDDSAGAIGVSGMQFAVDGYSLEGSAIALQGDGGATAIRVGDGTAAGASMIATIAAALTGDSTLVKSDLGTLVLTGANTYTGGTQVAAGTLVGNADAIRGDLANAGTVEFAQAADASFAGAIGGLGGIDGTMIKSGAGTLTLTGTSSLDWTIKAGGLSTDASRFTGNAAIQSGASLTFDQSASAVYAGVISGAGDFIKAGTGSLMLTGDSSAFTGTTLIEAGLLSINGQLGGTLEITGGKLGGNGTIGNLSVSGIVAPGNSIGTLHVGNVSLDPGSVYQVEVNAAGQSDQIIATGTATINGSTVQVLAGAGNYALQTQYTILTASGGRTGQFAGVTSNLAFLDPALSYDANNVYLTMTRNDTTLESVGRTRNQIAAAGGVDSLGAGNAVYDTVLGLSASQARSAFDQLSGELQASAQTALIEDSRFVRNAANDRLRAALGATGASRAAVAAYGDNRASGLPAQAAPTHGGPVFWSSVYGSWSRTGGDGNAAGLNRSSSGLLMGMDGKAGDWRLGVLTGYGQTGFDTSNPSASGSSKDYHLGAYGGTAWGNLSLRTGMAYTWHDIDTRRSVAVPGLYDSLKNHYRGGTLQAFGELAYGAEINGVRVEPYANIARVRLRTGSSGEQGGATALQTGKSADNITYTTLGVRAEHEFEIGSAQATLTGSLGWRHASGDLTPTVTQRFAGGSAFTVGGVPIARDSAVIEAGLDVALSRNATLNISYSGQLAATARDHSVKANLSVRF